ncbi:MAG: type II toxin-antitoxin system VapC family toxin [Anaerolineae bacterium]|nr:type II toxin-antitoxin system VapC family toxin [Anaerolineae bacterium]RIK14725.1 MAG: VapC toxin family PIN domain ribonuclease [Anaerolineae bacterium]
MILYTDTSALIKRYIGESGSSDVVAWIREADLIGVSIITRAEAGATFSRLHRSGIIDTTTAELLLKEFRLHWPSYMRLRINENLVATAESLAWQYGLRGYDAVHLASAVIWQESLGETVILATYDRQLWGAAALVGLEVLPHQL